MNTGNPHDLSHVRPRAERDGQGGRPAPAGRRRGPPNRRRRRRRPPPRRGWSLLGKLAAGLGVLVVLAGAGIATFLVVVSPAELVRNELIRQVKANTGRDLRITGGAHVVFYPSLGVSLGDVELSAPPGMAGGPMLTARQIDVSVPLMPLFKRQVLVDHVSLVSPVVDLRVDRNGRQSWQFADAGARVRVAGLGAAFHAGRDGVTDDGPRGLVLQAALPAQAGGFLGQLELRSIKLTDAVVRYSDARNGTNERIDDLDLHLTGKRIADPLKAAGGLVWQNERFTFDARLDTLSQLIANRAANARITLSGRPIAAGFDGTLKLGEDVKVAGQTRVSGGSLAETMQWFGTVLPNAAPLGGFQVSGRLTGSPKSATLSNATLSLGQTRATGVVSVALRPKRPYVSADLKTSALDIDRLSAGFAGARPAPKTRRGKLKGTVQPTPKSIEDLLRRSKVPASGAGRFAPQVRGYTNRNEWSSEPIDVSALGLVDAKLKMRIAQLKVAGLSIDSTALRLALKDRRARVDIDDIKLYQGVGKGVVTAQPARSGVSFGANLKVDKIAARGLLTDAAAFDRLDGRGNLNVVVSGSGASQAAIARSLNGNARFTFRDGAIVGWNLAKIVRGLKRGQFSNFDAVASEQTDFSELGGSFKITGGVATTRDLAMISPLLRLNGAGNVGIGARNLDLALRPRLVSSLRGQGGRGDASGLDIPVKLTGPWHAPRIAPDVESIARDPNKLIDQARKIGKQFKGKKIGDIVRGVLGNGDEEGDSPSIGGVKPKDLLNQLFR